jgi:outer membrane protein OmpA-like peptidoglycan-associated protein
VIQPSLDATNTDMPRRDPTPKRRDPEETPEAPSAVRRPRAGERGRSGLGVASAAAAAASLASLALLGACTLTPPAPAAAPAKKYEAPDERFAFFATAKSEVLPDGFFSIGYVVALMDADAARRVMIVGHADPHGKADANRELSFKRARAVRKALIDHGVKDERIEIAAPRDQSDTVQESLSRRADLYVFDPAQEDVGKRIGYPLDVKSE